MRQTDMVLEYMKEHGSITQLEATYDLGVTRLSSVVFDLREAGHKIKTVKETSDNRYGKPATYARYYLDNVQAALF